MSGKCAVKKAKQRRLLLDNGYLKRFHGNEFFRINQRVFRRLSHVSGQQNNREQSTLQLSVLYSVRMKLVQSEDSQIEISVSIEISIWLCESRTEIPVYVRTKCLAVFCEWCVKYVYFLLNPWGGKKECNLKWNRAW
jgi:hypothetical protein